MNFKEIDRRRCPWCGDSFYASEEECANRKMKACDSCGKRVRSGVFYKNREWIYIILSCFMLDFFMDTMNLILLYLAYPFVFIPRIYYVKRLISLLPLLYFLIHRNKFPVWRAYEVSQEETIGYADVQWYSMQKGGVGLPRLRFIDNMIFPACFLDGKGTPVSQTVCVRIHKKMCLFWKNSKVKMTSEELWKTDKNGKTPWEKAEKFVIFNNGEIVGEGKLWKEKGNIEKNI